MNRHVLVTPWGGAELNWKQAGRITRLALPRTDRKPSPEDTLPQWLQPLAAAIVDYFAGHTDVYFDLAWIDLDDVTEFRRHVYTVVHDISTGTTMTYGAVAAAAGNPGAARAVGSSMAANNFPLIIPCHRVIAAKQKLGQFGAGKPLKRRLLAMEGVDVRTLS